MAAGITWATRSATGSGSSQRVMTGSSLTEGHLLAARLHQRLGRGEVVIGADDVHDGVDEGQVREGLREVAQVASGARIDLLGVEVQARREPEHLLAQGPGAIVLADLGQRADQPEGA